MEKVQGLSKDDINEKEKKIKEKDKKEKIERYMM